MAIQRNLSDTNTSEEKFRALFDIKDKSKSNDKKELAEKVKNNDLIFKEVLGTSVDSLVTLANKHYKINLKSTLAIFGPILFGSTLMPILGLGIGLSIFALFAGFVLACIALSFGEINDADYKLAFSKLIKKYNHLNDRNFKIKAINKNFGIGTINDFFFLAIEKKGRDVEAILFQNGEFKLFDKNDFIGSELRHGFLHIDLVDDVMILKDACIYEDKKE